MSSSSSNFDSCIPEGDFTINVSPSDVILLPDEDVQESKQQRRRQQSVPREDADEPEEGQSHHGVPYSIRCHKRPGILRSNPASGKRARKSMIDERVAPVLEHDFDVPLASSRHPTEILTPLPSWQRIVDGVSNKFGISVADLATFAASISDEEHALNRYTEWVRASPTLRAGSNGAFFMYSVATKGAEAFLAENPAFVTIKSIKAACGTALSVTLQENGQAVARHRQYIVNQEASMKTTEELVLENHRLDINLRKLEHKLLAVQRDNARLTNQLRKVSETEAAGSSSSSSSSDDDEKVATTRQPVKTVRLRIRQRSTNKSKSKSKSK